MSSYTTEQSEDVARILAVLEDLRREAVRRERDSVRRHAPVKAVVYDQGIADGIRQVIAIIEGGKW